MNICLSPFIGGGGKIRNFHQSSNQIYFGKVQKINNI